MINLGDLNFSQGLATGGSATDPTKFLQAFSQTIGVDFVGELDGFLKDHPLFENITSELKDSFSANSGLEVPILRIHL